MKAARLALASISLLALAPACSARGHELGELPEAATIERGPAREPLVLAHGGQGSPASQSEGPARAVERGHALLREGGDPLEVAIATIEVLEDDPNFNAGTGSNLRLDGRTIEADAAVMDDRGRFGAVAGVSGIRHPVRLAERVAGTPHLLIAGVGAMALAARLGLEPADLWAEPARIRLERGYERLLDSEPGEAAIWPGFDWRAHWNFEGEPPADLAAARAMIAAGEAARVQPTSIGPSSLGPSSIDPPNDTQDTVGVVVRTAEGRYAAALSTGGTTLALRGRIGDVPLLGDGLYAGPHGAVAATGKGEAIIREQVAREVYRRLAAGLSPNDAIRLAIRDIRPDEGVGVIAVGESGWGAVASSQMAWALREGDTLQRADDFVQHVGR
ncbi:isoaspartyl peptidase/L-asparaginase [Nannocystaceae bacterium ST9]